MCLCEESKRQSDCSIPYYNTRTYPGQEFSICLAVVSYSWLGAPGVVPGIFAADMPYSNATLQLSQRSQASNYQTCTNLSYSFNTMLVDTDALSAKGNDDFVFLTLHLMECPLGFPLSPNEGKCICDTMMWNAILAVTAIGAQPTPGHG